MLVTLLACIRLQTGSNSTAPAGLGFAMLLCPQVLGSQVVLFLQVGAHAAQATHCVAKDDPELLLLGCLACQVPGLHPGAIRVALKLIFNSPKSVQLVLWDPRGLGTEPPTSPPAVI